MKYKHVDFNRQHWISKGKEEFMIGEAHHGFSKEEMEEAWGQINKAAQKQKEKAADTKLDGK